MGIQAIPADSPVHRLDFFKKIVDNLQIGVIISDHEGRIIYINDTYARFLDIDPLAEIGKHATDVVANSRLHIVAQTGQMEINYPHQFKEHGFLVHRVPIKEDDRVIAVVGLVLFDSASTASRLAEKVSHLQSKVHLYENELLSLRATRYTMDSIVGVSKAMTALKWQAIKAAATNLPVVIVGESGTGKELFAQAVHNASPRKFHPFVRVNCAAIPRELFESELFGYDKGAFTGAKATGKPGKIELAHHGSLFLDEIGDLPLEMQPKLLRVLEEKEMERVGGTRMTRSDFRLIAATHAKLESLVEQGAFRKDLYYRLNVLPLQIPPLRQRKEDIPLISEYLIRKFQKEEGTKMVLLSPEVMEIFQNYYWPGNVRELANILERILYTMDGDTVLPRHLPIILQSMGKESPKFEETVLKRLREDVEKEILLHTIRMSKDNKNKAARMLGIHRTSLYKKMKKFNIPLKNA